jgi:hypothetical protein
MPRLRSRASSNKPLGLLNRASTDTLADALARGLSVSLSRSSVRKSSLYSTPATLSHAVSDATAMPREHAARTAWPQQTPPRPAAAGCHPAPACPTATAAAQAA